MKEGKDGWEVVDDEVARAQVAQPRLSKLCTKPGDNEVESWMKDYRTRIIL